jgi:hypothetical protein
MEIKAIKLGSSWNSNSNHFHYFSNQVNKCMCGNFKSNHAIRQIQIYILGKEGKYEFWRIYQIFPNKFGSPINSTRVQKQFCFQNF